jgi:hypothetical protein
MPPSFMASEPGRATKAFLGLEVARNSVVAFDACPPRRRSPLHLSDWACRMIGPLWYGLVAPAASVFSPPAGEKQVAL